MAASSSRDTASTAQGKSVVSLPRETCDIIDALGARITEALEAQTGVPIELSRAQIIQAMAKKAMDAETVDATPEVDA